MRAVTVTSTEVMPGIGMHASPDGVPGVYLGNGHQGFDPGYFLPIDHDRAMAPDVIDGGRLIDARLSDAPGVSQLGKLIVRDAWDRTQPDKEGLLALVDINEANLVNPAVQVIRRTGESELADIRLGKRVMHELHHESAVFVASEGPRGNRDGFVIVNIDGTAHRLSLRDVDAASADSRKRDAAKTLKKDAEILDAIAGTRHMGVRDEIVRRRTPLKVALRLAGGEVLGPPPDL